MSLQTIAKEKEIRILSYNIKGLPGIAGGYNNKTRFIEIGKMLSERRKNGTAPQIVLLQESFIKETRAIREISGYPYIVKGSNASDIDENGKKKSALFNAGLYILSEYPIILSEKVAFGKKLCKSWDCHSNKGVQYAVIDVPDLPFYLPLANTHMQAGSKHDKIRFGQTEVIQRFIGQLKPDLFIFGGDFNITPALPSYQYWFEQMRLSSVGEYCLSPSQNTCRVKDGTDIDWVVRLTKDHIFYQSGLASAKTGAPIQVKVTPVEVERNFTEHHKGKPLSDHLGYETLLKLKW